MQRLRKVVVGVCGVALLLTSTARTGVAQQGTPEQQVIQLERDWCQAALKKDSALLGRILADDYTGVGSRGKKETKSEALADLPDKTSTVTAGVDTDVKVRVYNDAAVATGLGTRSGTNKGVEHSKTGNSSGRTLSSRRMDGGSVLRARGRPLRRPRKIEPREGSMRGACVAVVGLMMWERPGDWPRRSPGSAARQPVCRRGHRLRGGAVRVEVRHLPRHARRRDWRRQPAQRHVSQRGHRSRSRALHQGRFAGRHAARSPWTPPRWPASSPTCAT